ncbi:glycosyltransferase family 4 protein [Roseobacter sp.]|uniref:glycosyltransferase family 4 protein n=1 Tax=Roseobacter sp. TaxID=1907202 RepID=UPI0029673FBB|nr:glycosyltransferase family 4 protein [Roseobacter sp.]MDW3181171.1 glycosyltransferase family 4 protein [Roseobacter sp.]
MKLSSADQSAVGPNVLLVSSQCPTRAHAGGLRVLDIYRLLQTKGQFGRIDLFTIKNPKVDWSYEMLPDIFDTVYFAQSDDLSPAALATVGGQADLYDVIDFQFPQQAENIAAFQETGAFTLYTPMELLSRSYDMRPFLRKLTKNARKYRAVASKEIDICRMVDRVVCVSEPDANHLRHHHGLTSVTSLETCVSDIEFPSDLKLEVSPTQDVIFIAFFDSRTNQKALLWYLKEVHEKVRAQVPHYRLMVVGRGDLDPFRSFEDDSVLLIGEVDALADALAKAAVGIAPALGGAGIRGKLHQYAMANVPMVASPIAASSMSYQDGRDLLVAKSPKDFAAQVIKLLSDQELRRTMASNANTHCRAKYTWDTKAEQVVGLYQIQPI